MCMVPGCDRPAKVRGLCQKCHASAVYAIKTGKTTWLNLERAGLCKPVSRGRSNFAAALEAIAKGGVVTPDLAKAVDEALV